MRINDISTLQEGDVVMSETGFIAKIVNFRNNPEGELCVKPKGVSEIYDCQPISKIKVPIYKLEGDDDDILDAEDWEAIFKPIQNHFEHNEEDKILFETYGEELEFVKGHDNKKIWTLIDGNDGELYIIPGYHLIDRVHYFITEREWQYEFFCARYIQKENGWKVKKQNNSSLEEIESFDFDTLG